MEDKGFLLAVFLLGFALTLGYKVWLWKQSGKSLREMFIRDSKTVSVSVAGTGATWLLGVYMAVKPFWGDMWMDLPISFMAGSLSEMVTPVLVNKLVEVLTNLNLFKGEK